MKQPSPSLTPQAIIAYIQQGPQPIMRREIANAFHIKGNDRVTLKAMLKDLITRDELLKKGKSYSTPMSDLYCEAIVTELSPDGEILAEQIIKDKAPHPLKFLLIDPSGRQPSIAVGERVLVRYQTADKKEPLTGTFIKKLEKDYKKIIGIFQAVGQAGSLLPTNRREKGDYFIGPLHTLKAKDGDLVEIELLQSRGRGKMDAKVVKILGPLSELRSPTFIAIHDRELPTDFSADAIRQAESALIPPLKEREDLRHIPLVTIDDEDARDFDDAVWATPDPSPENKGGWRLIVAIADVSHYVKPDDALDHEAYLRGNSIYFPDQVIPMLPEALSNGLCSLRPNEDRACLAVEMTIDRHGKLLTHRFMHGLMQSAARLTYTQVQKAYDGAQSPDAKNIDALIQPLYGAFKSLQKSREYRGTLELDIPEERIYLAEDGRVSNIAPRERYDSHRLIEEFMVLANVAAAITLSDKNIPTIYRIHDEPDVEKVNALAEFLRSLGISFAKGQVMRPKAFNALLKQASSTPHSHAVHALVLRTQAQAVYSPENIGHFGLSLPRYCHFTSPIRRYADLIVHRALIHALALEPTAAYSYDHGRLQKIGEHISFTERRAAAAERETIERYVAGYLNQRIGDVFQCRISGISDAGLFLSVPDNGADGLVPMRTLPNDFYFYDRQHHTLTGRRHRHSFRLGETVAARLEESNPLTGGLIFSIVIKKSLHARSKPFKKEKQKNK